MAIWLKVMLSTLRSILNPPSLVELSVQDKLIFRHAPGLLVNPDGGAGIGIGAGVGVGDGVGVGVGTIKAYSLLLAAK
jgi:hypothetical protein